MVELEYAKALYELAKEENKTDLYSEYLIVVNKTANKKDFLDIISSPVIDKNEKKKILKTVYHKFDETFLGFLYVLIDHDRFNCISGIGHQYRKFLRRDNNCIVIDIYTAKELSDKNKKSLEDALKFKYKDKILEFKYIINPDLIGGIQIVSDGESIDASLKSTLVKIKETL